jgi:hypothetical protein
VLNEVNPDGSGKTVYASLPLGYQGISVNPAVVGNKVFGYSPSGTSPAKYGIYQNSAIAGAGAKMIVPPTYSFIEALQVSFDGRWVYYVAPIGNGDPALYKVSINGGQPLALDNTGFIFSANVDGVSGNMVTYDKEITNSQGQVVSAVFTLPTTGHGTPTMLVNDPAHNYEFPQFSKDATQIAFESDVDDPDFDIYVAGATGGTVSGSSLIRVTNMPSVSKEDGLAFGADGSSVAFIGFAALNSQVGLYVSGQIGANPPAPCNLIVQDSTIQSGLYWTSMTGRAPGELTVSLASQRRRQLHHQ